jgi:hypothetical protein
MVDPLREMGYEVHKEEDIEAPNGVIHAIDTVIGADYILRTLD